MAATDRPRYRRAPRALLALVATALLAGDASAQMQIDEIVITSGPAYAGGSFTDFFIDPVVFGSGIASVTISSQSGTLNATLVEVTPGEFVCDEAIPTEPCENFPSLAAISALGAITFDFLGDQGETDSETIPLADYDPGSGQPGFPDVTFPANGQTDVASNATLTWTSPPSWVEALAVGIENLATGLTPDEDLFFGAPVTTTSWAPAGMSSGNTYVLRAALVRGPAHHERQPRLSVHFRVRELQLRRLLRSRARRHDLAGRRQPAARRTRKAAPSALTDRVVERHPVLRVGTTPSVTRCRQFYFGLTQDGACRVARGG
jgi:hypothetical protein